MYISTSSRGVLSPTSFYASFSIAMILSSNFLMVSASLYYFIALSTSSLSSSPLSLDLQTSPLFLRFCLFFCHWCMFLINVKFVNLVFITVVVMIFANVDPVFYRTFSFVAQPPLTVNNLCPMPAIRASTSHL